MANSLSSFESTVGQVSISFPFLSTAEQAQAGKQVKASQLIQAQVDFRARDRLFTLSPFISSEIDTRLKKKKKKTYVVSITHTLTLKLSSIIIFLKSGLIFCVSSHLSKSFNELFERERERGRESCVSLSQTFCQPLFRIIHGNWWSIF